MARVLVAEDDPLQGELVRRCLARESHDVTLVATGEEALERVERDAPQLVVLDVMLPGRDGLDVTRALRERGRQLPILMLTARSTENDLLLGLELGADDYLSKPYSPRELIARVRALLRRSVVAESGSQERTTPSTLTVGDVAVDPVRRTVLAGGREVLVTRAEFDLLAELARNAEAVLSRSQLLTALHGMDEFIGERTVDTHIRNLRRKIEPDPSRPARLVTVYGVGYRLTARGHDPGETGGSG